MQNTYQIVTDRIVAMLESGVKPWQRSWTAGTPVASPFVRPLRSNGQPYRGANVLNLWAAGTMRGFTSPYWFTFQGAKDAGGHVRKGAKAELAFYVGKATRKAEQEGDDDRSFSFLKAYHVFNAC